MVFLKGSIFYDLLLHRFNREGLVLFLEYFPQTLKKWLRNKLSEGGKEASLAVSMVDRNLKNATKFMQERGLLHFDAHFSNILTDGKMLYLTDFGLATSSSFDLSDEKLNFFEEHQNYDRYYTCSDLATFIVRNSFNEEDPNTVLKEYAEVTRKNALDPDIEAHIKKYAFIAINKNNFIKKLVKDKTTPYPSAKLNKLGIE